VVRRAAIAGSVLNPVGYKILIEVLLRKSESDCRSVYVFCERHQGESKSKQYVEYWYRLRLLRRMGRFVDRIGFRSVGSSALV